MNSLLRLFAIASLSLAPACTGVGDLSNPGPQGGTPDAGDDPAPSADAGDPGPVDDGRVKTGLAALYKFDEGAGTVISDVSGVVPTADLIIGDPVAVTWLPTGGISVNQPSIVSAAAPPTKIYDACVGANEVSFEAWIKPADLEQDGPARILTYSIDTQNRNFTLGQALDSADARLRTTQTNNNGTPSTNSGPLALTGLGVQHVVFTHDAAQSTVYVDGVKKASQILGGNFEEWDLDYQLALANEITEDRPWLGEIHLAAVYCKRLNSAEVSQNYEAGY